MIKVTATQKKNISSFMKKKDTRSFFGKIEMGLFNKKDG